MDDASVDVVIVGGGAAGLYAAARLRESGCSVVVAESTPLFGGATATDTGQLWLPATHLSGRSAPDTPEAALDYLNAILGAETPASSATRREAFASTTDAVARWLVAHQIALSPVKGRVDAHPTASGARRNGRVLASAPFDRRKLGPLVELLRASDYEVEIAPRSARGLVAAASVLGHRLLNPTKDVVTGGAALAGGLLLAASQSGARLMPSSELVSLEIEGGRVAGAVLRRDRKETTVRARWGVLLATGGFEANADWRREHLPLPTDASWTTGLASNLGGGIKAAQDAGAQLAEMGEAWWAFVARFGGVTYRMTTERALPHGIIVDRAGDRFVNEAAPDPEAARTLHARNRRVRAVPSYLIVDDRHRQRYRLGPWLPGSAPSSDVDAIVKATSLSELAATLKIDQAGLLGTVVRFNGLAAKGTDADFKRGASAADRAGGDPVYRRNPNLGPLEKSPYWAVPLYPGDAGTKGGVVTDAHARVLRGDGTPIEGLYAVAGTSASFFKDTSPGAGAPLASALVDAHLAADHLVGRHVAAS